jgi:hypothetical protein
MKITTTLVQSTDAFGASDVSGCFNSVFFAVQQAVLAE